MPRLVVLAKLNDVEFIKKPWSSEQEVAEFCASVYVAAEGRSEAGHFYDSDFVPRDKTLPRTLCRRPLYFEIPHPTKPL